MAKKYTVVAVTTNNNTGVTKAKKHKGTLAELKSQAHFGEVLFLGDYWYQWDEPESKKVNVDPRGISSLVKNLNYAEKNRSIYLKSNETTVYELA